jgi:hypothetical protein
MHELLLVQFTFCQLLNRKDTSSCFWFRCRSVTLTVAFPDGKTQTIRAYREEAQALREIIRTHT